MDITDEINVLVNEEMSPLSAHRCPLILRIFLRHALFHVFNLGVLFVSYYVAGVFCTFSLVVSPLIHNPPPSF